MRTWSSLVRLAGLPRALTWSALGPTTISGDHWSGNASGARLKGGVYFLRLAASEGARTQRFVLLGDR